MSVAVLTWAFRLDLPSSEKFVLVALADCADETGACWPSQAELREKTCLGERTVRDAVKALESRGLLVRAEVRRADGSRRSDVYVLVGCPTRRQPPARHGDHWIFALPAIASALAEHSANKAGETAADAAPNRQELPVAEGADNRQIAPDQPADFAAPTGKSCPTYRQDLPVSMEPSSEPSSEPSNDDDAQALANPDFQNEAATDAAQNAEWVRQMVEAVGDPDLARAGYWQLEAQNGHFRRTWAALGLSEVQMLAVARRWRNEKPEAPQGPKAMGHAMAAEARRSASGRTLAQAHAQRAPLSDRVNFWVDTLRKGGYVAPSALTAEVRGAIVGRGFFTDIELRARGL